MYQLGAIQIDNNEYVLPYKADKNKNYKCIGCQQKVILKKGNIRKCHFAHHSLTQCSYYEHPNESELHKEAKYKLALWLKEKKSIEFAWSCCKTRYDGDNCGAMEGGMDHEIYYEENDKIVIEYRDINNKYIADVAIINDNKVKYIFEIKHTHSTTTNVRPEPWFEITTQQIFEEDINDKKDITLTCIRNNKNRYCSNCRILDEEWVNNLPRLYNKNGMETKWTQESPCIKCCRTAYSPVFVKGYRQLCKICLSICEDELKKEYDMKGKCLINIY
uniref:Competence protein CoiA-like N-terminal domain-containing protein n=1 Tax=viral metagenome TaxID=1070528 RepID=A0A6C0ARG8_9ZZZZ